MKDFETTDTYPGDSPATGTAATADMKNHDEIRQQESNPRVGEMTRRVGDQVMRVTVLPPEDPAIVRKRDGVRQECVGSRPMVAYVSPGTSGGRKAPKYIGERPGYCHR